MAITPKSEDTAKLKFPTEAEILKRITDAVASKDEEIEKLTAYINTCVKVDTQKLIALCEEIEKEAGNFLYSASFVKRIAEKIRNSIEGK